MDFFQLSGWCSHSRCSLPPPPPSPEHLKNPQDARNLNFPALALGSTTTVYCRILRASRRVENDTTSLNICWNFTRPFDGNQWWAAISYSTIREFFLANIADNTGRLRTKFSVLNCSCPRWSPQLIFHSYFGVSEGDVVTSASGGNWIQVLRPSRECRPSALWHLKTHSARALSIKLSPTWTSRVCTTLVRSCIGTTTSES